MVKHTSDSADRGPDASSKLLEVALSASGRSRRRDDRTFRLGCRLGRSRGGDRGGNGGFNRRDARTWADAGVST
jgi:hypothetical protein